MPLSVEQPSFCTTFYCASALVFTIVSAFLDIGVAE